MAVTVPPRFYDYRTNYGQVRTGQVTVGTTATAILEYSASRVGVVVTNTGTSTVFVGQKGDVANGNGHALTAGSSLSLVSGAELWGAVATGTALVTFLEEQLR